jgi:hypothetical protein
LKFSRWSNNVKNLCSLYLIQNFHHIYVYLFVYSLGFRKRRSRRASSLISSQKSIHVSMYVTYTCDICDIYMRCMYMVFIDCLIYFFCLYFEYVINQSWILLQTDRHTHTHTLTKLLTLLYPLLYSTSYPKLPLPLSTSYSPKPLTLLNFSLY